MKKIIFLLVTTTLSVLALNAQVLTPEDNSVYKKPKHVNKVKKEYNKIKKNIRFTKIKE